MLMMQYFGSIRLAWPMLLDANCISQIRSRNCGVILLSLYGRIFIHRWRLHCNIGAADCCDCICRSDGCCKLPFDVCLFIATVRKPDASGWHPNYTIPHGWFNMTQRRNLREKQDWWESSCRKALVKFLKVCSSYRDGMVTFYRTIVHLSKAVYVYDTIIQRVFIAWCVTVYSHLTHSVLRIRSATITGQDKDITEDEWMKVASSWQCVLGPGLNFIGPYSDFDSPCQF